MSKKVAVVLSGCGYLDGAEINESVFTFLAIDQQNLKCDVFAPDENQHHVVNHLAGSEDDGTRNALLEAARITRGGVRPLKELNPADYGGLVLPGGFGVAKNLSDFAFKGSGATVLPTLKSAIENFHAAGKPIAAICISPAIVASVLGSKGIKVTIGSDRETAAEIEKCGAQHIPCAVQDVVVDSKNKISSTPAFMYDSSRLTDVSKGISSCIEQLKGMMP